MPKLNKVTLLQMDGVLSLKETEDCVALALEGCKQIYEVQREALKKKYGIEKKPEAEQVAPEEAAEAEEPTEEAEKAEEDDER
jgi:exosome complex component RRP41